MQLKRSRNDRLLAMARQTASPEEAAIAQAMLAAKGLWPEPLIPPVPEPPPSFRRPVAWGAKSPAPRASAKDFTEDVYRKGVRDWDRWAKLRAKDEK